MAKKTETKSENIEREYVIPLRKKVKIVPRYKKTPKAIRTIKEFLARHMKIRDRDLRKIKIDRYLNEFLWFKGIKKPPHKIKVKAVKEGDIVKAELAEMPEKLKFKKAKEERILKKAEGILKGKKTMMEKAKEGVQKTEEEKKEEVEKKEEEKEKKAAVVEAGKEIEKAAAKKVKHEAKAAGKATKQKHQMRKALAK